jgi:hypothetical protein
MRLRLLLRLLLAAPLLRTLLPVGAAVRPAWK